MGFNLAKECILPVGLQHDAYGPFGQQKRHADLSKCVILRFQGQVEPELRLFEINFYFLYCFVVFIFSTTLFCPFSESNAFLPVGLQARPRGAHCSHEGENCIHFYLN